jgi:hypothetical protein
MVVDDVWSHRIFPSSLSEEEKTKEHERLRAQGKNNTTCRILPPLGGTTISSLAPTWKAISPLRVAKAAPSRPGAFWIFEYAEAPEGKRSRRQDKNEAT